MTINQFDAIILLCLFLACMGAFFYIGAVHGMNRGFHKAAKMWEKSALFRSALWKQEYLTLWKEVYPDRSTQVYLTDEERTCLADKNLLRR